MPGAGWKEAGAAAACPARVMFTPEPGARPPPGLSGPELTRAPRITFSCTRPLCPGRGCWLRRCPGGPCPQRGQPPSLACLGRRRAQLRGPSWGRAPWAACGVASSRGQACGPSWSEPRSYSLRAPALRQLMWRCGGGPGAAGIPCSLTLAPCRWAHRPLGKVRPARGGLTSGGGWLGPRGHSLGASWGDSGRSPRTPQPLHLAGFGC